MTSLEITLLVAQPHDLAPLRLEHLAHRALIGGRAVLVAVVLDLAGARLQPRRR
jgi:hypothetical protein